MNSIRINGTRYTAYVLAVGAFALAGLQAQAQIASMSRSATASRVTTNATTNVRVNGGTSSSRVGANGINTANNTGSANAGNVANVYSGGSASSYFGYPDFSGFGSYFGQSSLGGFGGGTLASGNITVVGSDTYGGFATLGPTGTYSFGQTGGYTPTGDPSSPAYNPNADTTRAVAPRSGSLNAKNAQDAQAKPEEPSLVQSLFVRRGRNFDVAIGWRGNPKLISGMTVTLLNRYHLPVTQQTAEAGTEAYFPANKDTFSAQYYRVDVQYADGAVASVMASLQK